MSNAKKLHPTTCQKVNTDDDAVAIIEQCLNGDLAHLPRPPHRGDDIAIPGNVYIFEKNASGFTNLDDGKRWTRIGSKRGLVHWESIDTPSLVKKTFVFVQRGCPHFLVSYDKGTYRALVLLHLISGRV